MLRQSSSRNQRNKVLRVKHVLQVSLLVAVCFWLLYQLKHSYDKKKAFVDENSEISSKVEQEQQRFVKLGRKDLPRNEKANLDEEREKEQEAVKQVMEEEEEIGEGEQVRGNERDDEERENEGEDTDGRGRGEASRVAREDRELEYEDDKSEENEEKMESGDENDEEKFVGDDDNDNDAGSTIDDDTNFGEGDGDGDSSLKKTVPDDNASTNGVGSNHNESIVGLDGKEGSLNDHHHHQIAASDGDTDNSVALQNQTFNLESMEEEKHVSVKREIDEENKPTPYNSSFTIEQEDFGENSPVSVAATVAANDVGDVDVNKIVADAHLDLSTLPLIQGEVVKAEEDAAE